MKKLVLAAFALTTAVSVFAQGSIAFNDATGTWQSKVYAPLSGSPTNHQLGQAASDLPVGSTDWSAYTKIGAVGIAGQYGGSATMAQLLIANGSDQPELSLIPQTPIITFRTGGAAGFLKGGTTLTAANVTGTGAATIEMVAWDNFSGLYPTWTQASVAWKAGLIAAAESGRWNDTLGGFGAPPGTPPNLQAPSMNLYFIGIVPEPSTFALAGLGLAALVAFRRRNSK